MRRLAPAARVAHLSKPMHWVVALELLASSEVQEVSAKAE